MRPVRWTSVVVVMLAASACTSVGLAVSSGTVVGATVPSATNAALYRPIAGSVATSWGTAGVGTGVVPAPVYTAGAGVVADDGSVLVAGRTAGNLPGALRLTGVAVPNYVQGSTDFTSPAGAFGACLERIVGATAADWLAAGIGACVPATGAVWHTVSAASPGVRLATTASTQSGSVDLRFGFRAGSTQAPGRHIAPVTFEVVAPAA